MAGPVKAGLIYTIFKLWSIIYNITMYLLFCLSYSVSVNCIEFSGFYTYMMLVLKYCAVKLRHYILEILKNNIN